MRRGLFTGAIVLGATGAILAVLLARSGDNAGTTYTGTTWPASLATLAAALALFAAAPFARSRTLAVLALAAGVCWLAPIYAAWPTGPPILRAAATIVTAFTFPLLVHLALAAPAGRLGGRAERAVLTAIYAWTALAAILLALMRDPFYDPNCWSDCDGNAFLVWPSRGLADALLEVRPWTQLALGALVIGLGARRLARPAAPERVTGLAAAVVGAVAALHALMRLSNPLEEPLDPGFRAVFFAACGATVLVALALVAPYAQVALRRRALRRVVAMLDEAPAPGELERTLATTLDDPSLHFIFRLPEEGRCVDASGAECDRPSPSLGRTLTPLARGGEPVAWIEHDPTVDEAIEPALTPAVRLSLENARLRTALLAQVRKLREARQQVVLDGDDERRRLERDLHDGVQQQLLALGAELRAAAEMASEASDEAASRLEAAVDETTALLEEVRSLAHGIYPAILTDGGLAPAVASLADVARLPVKIVHAPTSRYAASVETTAYRVVAESIENAVVHSNATSVAVDLGEQDGTLVVCVSDDGQGGAAVRRVGGLAELVDRVGAIDGTISVASLAGNGTTISAVIPCAS